MKITGLVLHEVACFDHLELRFPDGKDPDKADVHLLVGDNGTGKSAILRAMAQFFTHESTGLAARIHESPTAHVELDAGWRRAFYRRTRTAEERALPAFMQTFREYVDHLTLVSEAAPMTPLETNRAQQPVDFAAFAFAGMRQFSPNAVVDIREQRSLPLEGALSFDPVPESIESDEISQWIANARAKEAFALNRGDQTAAQRRRASVQRLERAMEYVTGTPIALQITEEPLAVSIEQRGRSVPLALLPDGIKSILSWLGGLLMRLDRVRWENDLPIEKRPFALFLDEIEVHLHPAWQWKVVPMLQTLFPKAQVFLATHSPFVVASADDAWVHRLEFEGDRVVAREPLPSRVGFSYQAVLQEIFHTDQFDPESERLLRAFYDLQTKVLRGESDYSELEGAALAVARRGVELDVIVRHELLTTRHRLNPKSLASEP
jgi:predicted ATP-binding protein involved in virulence